MTREKGNISEHFVRVWEKVCAEGARCGLYGPCPKCGYESPTKLDSAEWGRHMAAHRIKELEDECDAWLERARDAVVEVERSETAEATMFGSIVRGCLGLPPFDRASGDEEAP